MPGSDGGKANAKVSELKREDSAHEDNDDTVSWKVHVPRRMQRSGRACRDSASSFDR